MVVFTPAAVEAVKVVVAAEPAGNQGLYLRVGVRGGGCSGFEYDMDIVAGDPPESAFQWHQEGLPVLVVMDVVSAQYLRGTTIDYVRQGLQEGFRFTNPVAKSTCGCGKSFSTST